MVKGFGRGVQPLFLGSWECFCRLLLLLYVFSLHKGRKTRNFVFVIVYIDETFFVFFSAVFCVLFC